MQNSFEMHHGCWGMARQWLASELAMQSPFGCPPRPPLLPLPLYTHTHMHMQTYIEISQAPSPSPRELTLSACLTRKQAWVLGWSENTDLHKSMLCLLLFHHCPLEIHIWPLHIVCTALHAVALVFSQVNIHADWIASLSASFCASTLSGCKRLLL